MRATRRAAVTASGVAALGLAGCTGDVSGTSPTRSGSNGSTATEGASPDPDRAALDRAAVITAAMLAETQGTGPRVDPGGRLAELHRAHLTALERVAGPTATPVPRTAARRMTRTELRRFEMRTQRELAALALEAGSGAVARLLASMSAGIAAHLAMIDRVAR